MNIKPPQNLDKNFMGMLMRNVFFGLLSLCFGSARCVCLLPYLCAISCIPHLMIYICKYVFMHVVRMSEGPRMPACPYVRMFVYPYVIRMSSECRTYVVRMSECTYVRMPVCPNAPKCPQMRPRMRLEAIGYPSWLLAWAWTLSWGKVRPVNNM